MGKRGIRIGAAVGMAVGLWTLWKEVSGVSDKGNRAVLRLTGYNIATGRFNIKDATAALPMVGGVALSMVASKVGLNRYTPKGINI